MGDFSRDFTAFLAGISRRPTGPRFAEDIIVTPSVELTRADELFAALDGHILATDDSRWEVRVAGVHEEGDDVWAQLIISGPRQYAGTFRSKSANPVDLLASVEDWLTDCESLQPAVLSLARI